LRTAALVGAVAVLVAGCGDDDDAAVRTTIATTTTHVVDLEAYCAAMLSFTPTVSGDVLAVEVALAELQRTAGVARQAADAAPEEIRADQEALADAADAISRGVRAVEPADMTQFQQGFGILQTSYNESHPELDGALERVDDFADEACAEG
jgi:hypothetical protein